MAVVVITTFTLVFKDGSLQWAAPMAAWPSNPNGDSGPVTLGGVNIGGVFFCKPNDPGGVSDPLTSVLLEFDYAVTNTDPNGMGEFQYPTQSPTEVVGPGLSLTGHISKEMGPGTLANVADVATLFGAGWAGWAWNSEYDGVFVAYDQRLVISNFTVTVTFTAGSLDSLTPTHGTHRGGTLVTLTGSGFTGATVVTFGGTAADSVIVVNDTTIICVTPPHVSALVDVAVVGVGTRTNAFTFMSVDRVSPRTGTVAGGTAVTITGFGFNAPATGVTIGGAAAAFVIDSNTQISAVTPAHASGIVDVVVAGVDTGERLYTYTLPIPQSQGSGPLLPPIPTRRNA